MTDGPLKSWLERDEQILRLQLAKPKANIIDAAMIDALSSALESHTTELRMMAVVLYSEGSNVRFCASCEEYLP